ncbi:MAG: zinc ABC transporter substrate-binding protein [Lachnospiraceae bacterium]|nr:zinc ABC transporter substrate-binding protein [Lachnospiraceae bacterium]
MKIKQYRKNILCIAMIIVMITGLTACVGTSKKEGKLSIVTTLFPQYDFAKQIAGDKAEVLLLLSPGIEAHSYDPSPSDIVKINESDLFIYTGEYMETWAAQIIKSLEKDVNILDVSKGIKLELTEEDEEQEEGYDTHNHVYDPHIWTSPVMAGQMVENILNELIKIDAENEEYYRKNAQDYLAELSELDREFRQTVEQADIKTLYFADKFAMYYFTREYGISYISAYDSCSSETEPSAKLVADMIDKVKRDNAPAVFYAELSNHKAADTISKETKTKSLLLHSCHNVSKEEFKNGATYISLMKQNLENLKAGLYRVAE